MWSQLGLTRESWLLWCCLDFSCQSSCVWSINILELCKCTPTPQPPRKTCIHPSSHWLNIYHHNVDHFSNCRSPLKISYKLISFKTFLEKRPYVKCRYRDFISELWFLICILTRLNFTLLMIQKILLCNNFLSGIMFILRSCLPMGHFYANWKEILFPQDSFLPFVRNLS